MLALPPLHPMVIHFPAALLPASLAADVAGKLLGRPSLRHGAWWMLLYGTIAAPVAAASGWLWLRSKDPGSVEDGMTIHKWLGTALVVVFLPLVAWRWRAHAGDRAPGWTYLAATALAVGLMAAQAHMGGMMSFGE
jgi:uncharacterized membrane protein